jgi:hypothetical protein
LRLWKPHSACGALIEKDFVISIFATYACAAMLWLLFTPPFPLQLFYTEENVGVVNL